MEPDAKSLPNDTPDAPGHRPMRFTGCALALVLFAVALGGFLTALPTLIRTYVSSVLGRKISVDPKQLHRFFSEPVQISQSLIEPPACPPQLDTEFKRLLEVWDKRPLKLDTIPESFDQFDNVFTYRSSDEDTKASATAILKAGEALAGQVSRLVRQPGYTFDLLAPPLGLKEIEGDDSKLIKCSTALLNVKACERACAQDGPEALSSSLTLLRLPCNDPLASVFTQHIAMRIHVKALKCLASVALECTSTKALSDTLHELNQLKPFFDAPRVESGETLDIISTLRAFRRDGYPVQVSKAKPLAQYMVELREKTGPEYRRWLLARIDPRDFRRPFLMNLVKYDAENKHLSLSQQRDKWLVRMCPELFVSVWAYSSDMLLRLEKCHQVTKAQYDLTRLLIAGRLAQAEGAPTSSSLEVLVPRYLPEIPLDPFSQGKPYLWDACRGLFYSIGPDGVDNNAKLLYNESTSFSGDIEVNLTWPAYKRDIL